MSIFTNHTMSMITDPNLIGPEINNVDFVTVACVSATDQFNNHPNVYDASILMPTTEILMAWADGNELALINGYPQYLLNCQDADDMIVALLTALTKKNIAIFIPQDEYEVYGQLLLNHIYFMYGVTMNTPTSMFSFNESKLPLLLSKFYMMDLMEPADYLATYPPTLALPEFVINKLAMELKPFGDIPATYQQYAEYFNKLIASGINKAKQIIITKKV